MLEKLLIGVFVLTASLYAFRSLAPSRWLAGRTAALAESLRSAGYPTGAKLVQAYAPDAGGSCGGCGSCETDASAGVVGGPPGSAFTSTAASGGARTSVPTTGTEKTLHFVRRPGSSTTSRRRGQRNG